MIFNIKHNILNSPPDNVLTILLLDILILDSLNYEKIDPINPLRTNQLTEEEIKRCEKNEHQDLKSCLNIKSIIPNKKARKYIPLAFRLKKIEIITWFINLKKEAMQDNNLDADILKRMSRGIAKALSTNNNTVCKIIDDFIKSPDKYKEICDPIRLGICTQDEVDLILSL